jgi:hypothetical protein
MVGLNMPNRIALSAVVVASLAPTHALAATCTVGIEPYSTLAACVEASVAGDEIVLPGTYKGEEAAVYVGVSVTIRSASASYPARVPVLGVPAGVAVTLEDVAIGGRPYSGGDTTMVAVLCGDEPTLPAICSSGDLTLSSVSADTVVGVGILALDGTVEATDLSFDRHGTGQALVVLEGATASVGGTNSSFRNCTLGAIAVYGTLTLEDVEFSGNGSGDVVGADLQVTGGNVSVTGGSFTDGVAFLGGSLYQEGGVVVIDAATYATSDASDGGAWYATLDDSGARADLHLYNITLFGTAASNKGGALHAFGADVEIQSSVIDETDSWKRGGGLYLSGASTLLMADTAMSGFFLPNEAESEGGAIYAWEGSELELNNIKLTCGSTATAVHGGAIGLGDATVAAVGLDVDGCRAHADGGAITARTGASLEISNSSFVGTYADGLGGSIYGDHAALIDVSNTDFIVGFADSGGAIAALSVGALVVADSTLNGNQAFGIGGALLVDGGGTATLTRNLFCDNAAPEVGGVAVGTLDSLSLYNNVVQGSSGANGSALAVQRGATDGAATYLATVQNNTFVDNGGVAIQVAASKLTFTNNIAMGSGTGLVLGEGTGLYGDYNLFYDNALDVGVGLADLVDGTDDVAADPLFVNYGAERCVAEDLALSFGSPAVDTGDPGIEDPDGSRSDIGAFGGSRATQLDRDADGYPLGSDCDDEDPSVHPNATETCDGVDQDCDGLIDEGLSTTWYEDGDADGFGNDQVVVESCADVPGHVEVGGDCDDSDPDRYPGSPDGDCPGTPDDVEVLTFVTGGGGCQTAPAGPWWLVLPFLVALRQRQRSRA